MKSRTLVLASLGLCTHIRESNNAISFAYTHIHSFIISLANTYIIYSNTSLVNPKVCNCVQIFAIGLDLK